MVARLNTKRAVSFGLKLIISGGLIAWVLMYQVNLRDLRNVFLSLDLRLLGVAFLMKFLGLVIGALRWKKLLEFQKININLRYLIDSYIVALFFNNFLPTRIGGDIVRINDLSKASNSIYQSASTVFVERFFGIGVLLLFALIASLIRLPLAQKIPAIWMGLGLGTTGMCIIIICLRSGFLDKVFRKIPSPRLRQKLLEGWEVFQKNSLQLISKREPLKWGGGYSTVLQLNVVLHFWIIGKAFGFNIALLDYFFLIPIQMVILMVPSINGIGLREASSIFLFSAYGISASEAVMFGFADFIMLLAMGFLGWVRFMTRNTYVVNAETGSEDVF